MRARKLWPLISLLIVTSTILYTGCKSTVNEESFSTTAISNVTPTVISIASEDVSDHYITVMGLQGVKIYITDPQGRHLGIEPTLQEIVIEIPEANFENNPTWEEAARGDTTDEPEQLLIAHILHPIEGVYQIQIFGTLEPPGGGLGLSARRGDGGETRRLVSIDYDQVMPVEYQFTYSLSSEELITELVIADTHK